MSQYIGLERGRNELRPYISLDPLA